MSKLILSPGEANSTVHELAEDVVTIGRAPDNIIQIADPSVSGRHAHLSKVGEAFHLQDLESTNGTRVNGELVTSIALKVGDRIRFGKVEGCFECDVPSGAQPLPVLAEVEARPAEVSTAPVDFANASPFPHRKKTRDLVRNAIFAGAAVAILAFVASLLALAQMQPPTIP